MFVKNIKPFVKVQADWLVIMKLNSVAVADSPQKRPNFYARQNESP